MVVRRINNVKGEARMKTNYTKIKNRPRCESCKHYYKGGLHEGFRESCLHGEEMPKTEFIFDREMNVIDEDAYEKYVEYFRGRGISSDSICDDYVFKGIDNNQPAQTTSFRDTSLMRLTTS